MRLCNDNNKRPEPQDTKLGVSEISGFLLENLTGSLGTRKKVPLGLHV